ncbi:MAG TPA: xylose isomerase [Firmicutes bacterium]|nr:xylose isomerase [Bacillota bacterium]
MQGRLLPKYQGRYQAHPVDYWQGEFQIAKKLGLSLIEFIFDFEQFEKNPLMHQSGLDEIRRLSEQTEVQVKTICADYLMEAPVHGECDLITAKSCELLCMLLKNAKQIGVTNIVIPCVDGSSFKNEQHMLQFAENICSVRDVAENVEINLALETDLPPKLFLAFLETLDSRIFTVNYDTGNSAALGYDPSEELTCYGKRISDIHLKDRLRNGNSVELGQGNTDFQKFFTALAQTEFSGPFIMQAFRDDEGVQIFKKQLEWIMPRIDNWVQQKEKILTNAH